LSGRKKNTRGFGVRADLEVTCPRCGGTGKVAPEAISIGDRFKACRTKLGKTQAEMAPVLQISRAQLANLEGDRSRPGLEMLVRAADAFGVSIDHLLGRR
jgi:DNA-binding XRE family transcriptional regulator